MPPNLNPAAAAPDETSAELNPVIEIFDDLVSTELHQAAWEACNSHRWYFGHGSNTGGWARFWKLDLEEDPAFQTIWRQVRERCEALAGGRLEVLRVYGNGHTYGLGGEAHRDDARAGTFTLLYYPNPEWKDGWDGETVYYDQAGEVALAVRYRPNRAVFFDSRIVHVGRAPSRQCTALRVTVAYKLQLVDSSVSLPVDHAASAAGTATATPSPALPPAAAEDAPASPASAVIAATGIVMTETGREGALHVYSVRVPEAMVSAAVDQNLAALGKNVKLPGFKPGRIPREVLLQRYGQQARTEALKQLVGLAIDENLPKGSVPASLAVKKGAEGGDLEFELAATFVPHLPWLDMSNVTLEQLTALPADLAAAGGVTAAQAAVLFRRHLRAQVLDHLDRTFPFPVFPGMVERELATIIKAAEENAGLPLAGAERDAVIEQLRAVAQRRLRLGFIVAELARRDEIRAAGGAQVEQLVVERLIAQAKLRERAVTLAELRALMEEG